MLARKEIPPRRPRSEWSAEEEELRIELAAAYRVCALLGWEDSINNHLTVMMPAREGQPPTFLVNSYGYAWEEVTASSLIEIDLQGNILDPGSAADDFDGDAFRSPRVLPAAFAIHGAIHTARTDGTAQCVMHTHEKHVAALSSLRCGLLPMSQTALLTGDVAYHKFGPPLTENECDDMVASMGDKYIMLLENHGVIACKLPRYRWHLGCILLKMPAISLPTGGKTVAHAFVKLFYIHKAAEIQILAMQCVSAPSPPPKPLTPVPLLVFLA